MVDQLYASKVVCVLWVSGALPLNPRVTMIAGLSRNLTCEDRPSLVQTQAGVRAGEAPPLPVVGATVAPRHVLLLITPPCFFTISFFVTVVGNKSYPSLSGIGQDF